MESTLPLTNGSNGTKWGPSHTVPLFLNGKQITTDTTFDVGSPVTNELAWKCSSASKEDALAAIDAAQKAFPAWSTTKVGDRQQIFLRAAQAFEDRKAELVSYAVQEMGAGDAMANFTMGLCPGLCRDVAGKISTALKGSVPEVLDEHQTAIVYKEPYGVCLGIAPWSVKLLKPSMSPTTHSKLNYKLTALSMQEWPWRPPTARNADASRYWQYSGTKNKRIFTLGHVGHRRDIPRSGSTGWMSKHALCPSK